MKKVFLNKISSIAKNVNLTREIEVIDNIDARIGALLAVKIINANTKYNILEIESGRMCVLNDGDIIPVALGNRFASRGMCGIIPESISSGDVIDILNIGGVAGKCIDYNVSVGKPVKATVIGAIAKNGRPLHLEDSKIVMPQDYITSNVPVITILGSGMDSGKTTIGSLIVQMLASAGKKIAVAKVTGVGAMKDVYKMIDYGATAGLSFVDAGLPSTCIKESTKVVSAAKGIINCLSKDKPDAIFIEFGDGLYGRYCVKDVLLDKEIKNLIKLCIICTSDVPGALKLHEDCMEIGIIPDFLSGPVTDNIAGIELVKEKIKINTFNAMKGTSIDSLAKILTKID